MAIKILICIIKGNSCTIIPNVIAILENIDCTYCGGNVSQKLENQCSNFKRYLGFLQMRILTGSKKSEAVMIERTFMKSMC